MQPVYRFAPSPNGRLHLGHALSALTNHGAARASGGRFLLRIEDIDETRCRPEFEAAIYDDLKWLGLDWDGAVRRQSQHFDEYRAALAKLDGMGLLYPAYESRGERKAAVAAREAAGQPWPRDPDGAPLYRRPAQPAPPPSPDAPYVLRLDVEAALARIPAPLSWLEEGEGEIAADPRIWGDVVLARRDVPASYHLAVVVDDALQGVTDVVRGRDLYAATAIHRLLQALLGLPAPRYCHHRLILDEDGRKLSKSTGATALAALRAAGASPADIRRRVGLVPDAGAENAAD